MKLGLDGIVLDALKELSAADTAYMATFEHLDETSDVRKIRDAAFERLPEATDK